MSPKSYHSLSLVFGAVGAVSTVIALVMPASNEKFLGISGPEGLLWILVWFAGAIWFNSMSKH